MRRALLSLLSAAATLALALPVAAQIGSREEVPVSLPERPFLLVDAPRRFLPSQPANVRIQLREGGRVRLALFRVNDPETILGQAGRRQGISVAQGPMGEEAEALLWAATSGSGRSRRGQLLTLVRQQIIAMPAPRDIRRVWDETEVYDSNEEEESEVATYWVRNGSWAVRNQSLGRLPAGLYLVRVHGGPWATSALLSVGDLVMLARRGDHHDQVLVTDGQGNPLPGLEVEARAEGQVEPRRLRTDRDGQARFPAADQLQIRYVVRRGADLAFADVSHARLDPCDPRVYVATGRPVYRPGETIYVRGHVRGCDGRGRYRGLSGETLRLWTQRGEGGEGVVEATTDGDGNFVAELVARGGEVVAELSGLAHRRPLRLDSRRLPRRSLELSIDRAWAVGGQVVQVTVADQDGGWPRAREVILTTPAGRLVEPIGPGRPAVFFVRVPQTEEASERLSFSASITDDAATTMAAGELWIGRHPTLLAIDAAVERGEPGQAVEVTLRATNLGGSPAPGPVELALYRSDGNEPQGPALWRSTTRVEGEGRRLQVPLSGPGPWLVEARREGASGRLMIWERRRPPALSRRGELAVLPGARQVEPGAELALSLRLPAGPGRTWVTLEQGSLWTSRLLPAGPQRIVPLTLPVPAEARGLASVVVSRIEDGQVRTATAAVEVSTSRELSLSVATDRRLYAEGAEAHVVIEGRGPEGEAADAVISLWLADGGYWDLGDETYPLPGDYLRLPGRAASAGDSTTPIGYGAEEGRVVDALLEWNGQRLDGTTHRHGWAYGGELVDARARGRVEAVLSVFARAAGFQGLRLCEEVAAGSAEVELSLRRLPWDLVALRLAEVTGTEVIVDGQLLDFQCPGGLGSIGHGGGGGSGSGYGAGGGGLGTRGTREQRLYGTLRFIGLRRLGADGRLELDLPLPEHPGRWRVEVLAIADDGGGARAHQVVHTSRALQGWVELPRQARPGDELDGVARLSAPGLAGQEVTLLLDVGEGLELIGQAPRRLRLDDRGEAEAALRLRATSPGEVTVRLDAAAGAARDSVQSRVEVRSAATARPISLRALVGEEAWELHLPLPALVAPATLQVSADRRLAPSIDDVLEALRHPRWDTVLMRLDRLATLRGLARAAEHLPRGEAPTRTRRALEQALRGEVAALEELQSVEGGLGWWRSLPDSGLTTGLALQAMGGLASQRRWQAAWSLLRRGAREPAGLSAEAAALTALLLAGQDARGDQELARGALAVAEAGLGDGLDVDGLVWTARAADALNEAALRDRALTRLEAALERLIGQPRSARAGCRGPAWFLCYARWGDRGVVARAALALLDLRRGRGLAARAAQWLAVQPPTQGWWVWGSDEADAIALIAELSPPDSEPEPFEVLIDGTPQRAISRVEVPQGARQVTIRFPASAGRLRPIRVDGEVLAEPPSVPLGPSGLARRFLQDGRGQWSLEVALSPTESAQAAELILPMPAGLELAPDARAPEGARLTNTDQGVEVSWRQLPAGPHTLTLPLVVLGEGRFSVGAARLRSADGVQWGLTPAASVQVTGR